MTRRLGRRPLLITCAASLSLVGGRQALAAVPSLAAIEARHGGRLGVFVIETGSGRILAYRPDERFTMCSTSKLLLAAQVLSRVETGRESLARLVHYDTRDLSQAGYPDFLCPVTAANVQRGALTVGTLCRAMVEVSDNLAAILLMRTIGGPAALTGFLRSLGDDVTRSDRYEPASNAYDGPRDTTTPRAITTTMKTILLGSTFSRQSRELLESWMIDATPGLRRLRASFPSSWMVGDKAGTNGPDETNDVAIAWRPGHSPLLAAAYYDAPRVDADARDAALREIGAAIATWTG